MIGPLTAADPYVEEDEESEEETSNGFEVQQSAVVAPVPQVSDIRRGYETAIAELKARRRGLSGKEKLGALLVGFGQPTRYGGNWKDSAANAAQALMTQSIAARGRDDKRDALIAKYEAEAPYKTALGEAAVARAKAAGTPKIASDATERHRLGIVKRLFPGVADAEILSRNLLYDPKVDREIVRQKAIVAAAQGMGSSGDAPEELMTEVTSTVVQPPSWEQWVAAARQAPQNAGKSEAELRVYYDQKYRGG